MQLIKSFPQISPVGYFSEQSQPEATSREQQTAGLFKKVIPATENRKTRNIFTVRNAACAGAALLLVGIPIGVMIAKGGFGTQLCSIDERPQALVDKGREFQEGHDFQNAIQCFQYASDKGFGPGAFQLGQMYESGQGVVLSVDQAIKLYEKADTIEALRRIVEINRFGKGNAQYEKLVYRLIEKLNVCLYPMYRQNVNKKCGIQAAYDGGKICEQGKDFTTAYWFYKQAVLTAGSHSEAESAISNLEKNYNVVSKIINGNKYYELTPKATPLPVSTSCEETEGDNTTIKATLHLKNAEL